MRWLPFTLAIVMLGAGAGLFFYQDRIAVPAIPQASNQPTIDPQQQRLKHVIDGIRNSLANGKFNSRFCFLVDMKIHAGSKRFFVYDTSKDSIILKGLVTHGGGDISDRSIQFSNAVGSNCTSLGTYKIGKPYNGKFGLAYKLYGLDKSNSNAFNRFVVLHAHPCVPDHEVSPVNICCSLGCPTVSPAFLQQLKKYLDKPGKPILLHIFN